MQTWNIGGKSYTHGQLMELRKKKLDPLKDKIVMAEITPRPEAKDDAKVVTQPSNYMQLKALAKQKGMVVTKDTKKEDVLKFLASSEEQSKSAEQV